MPTLDLSRWREISPYLDQVLDCECEARAAWLEKLRNENPRMARDIETLLAEQQALEAAGFMGTLERNFRGLLSYLPARFRSVQ